MNKFERFLDLGFRRIGEWYIFDNKISFRLFDDLSINNFLYGFISESTIKYIGKSTQSLFKRLNGYQNPGPTQNTNIRINKIINQALSNNIKIEIYLFFSKEIVTYKGFEVNISAGLEDVLIDEFLPEWNLVGKQQSYRRLD